MEKNNIIDSVNIKKPNIVLCSLVLLASVGIPFLPYSPVPIVLFIILLGISNIKNFLLENRRLVSSFFAVTLLSLVTTVAISEDWRSMMFGLQLAFKIVLEVFFGVIVAECILNRKRCLIVWILSQIMFIIGSIFYPTVFDFLVACISPGSRETFSELWGTRSVGFGIYHVDGAVTLAFLSILPFLYKCNLRYYEKCILFTGQILSLTLARTALVVLFPFYLYKRPIVLLLATVILVAASKIVSEEAGSLYHAFELFRNYNETGELRSVSTDANINMLVFPSTLSEYIFGTGYFFDENTGGFYQDTDLGWLRLIWFGGIPYAFIYFLMNVWFLLWNNMWKTNVGIFVLLIVLISNAKGLYIGGLISIICMIFESKTRARKEPLFL